MSRSWFLALLVLFGVSVATAQELEPRTYANAPVGVNFVALGYAFSTGNVLLDPSLPIENLDADLHTAVARYTRTFGLWGRSSKVKVIAPYAWGDWKGLLEGESARRRANGFGDARFKLEVNFLGAPALERSEFRDFQQKTIVGASLQVITPTGDYDSSELINLGSNRWTFVPEIGASRAFSKFICELAANVWLFGDNTNFLNGRTLSQDPLWVAKAHFIWSLKPGEFLALGIGYGDGGRSNVNGVPRQTEQQNWRVALTFAYPIRAKHGVSLAGGTGVRSRRGTDFDFVGGAYQYSWGGN